MLKIHALTSYKKDFKRLARSGSFDGSVLKETLLKIANGETLGHKYRDHQLYGELSNFRECHLQNDLVLVYEIDSGENTLYLVHIGSHSELFG